MNRHDPQWVWWNYAGWAPLGRRAARSIHYPFGSVFFKQTAVDKG
jgi:hypothetical protein